MLRLQRVSKETAQKFSAGDWIGIAEAIFAIIKQCREDRQSPEQIKENVRGGLFAKIRMRKSVRKHLDRQKLSFRQMNKIADNLIEQAQADESGLDEVISEVDNDTPASTLSDL